MAAVETIKILGINGSPRKASTYYALREALKSAAKCGNVETEIISLHNLEIKGCRNCDYCARNKTHCIQKDDFTPELMQKFVDADGYIIASPVYNMGITSQLQAFFNRFRPLHKVYPSNILEFKVGGAITIGGTRNGGQETAIQAIHQFYFCREIIIVGGGRGAYSGGKIWSKDNLEQGTKNDEIGLQTAHSIGRRVATIALTIKQGINS